MCPLCCFLASSTAGTARLLCLKLFKGFSFPTHLPGLAALRSSCTPSLSKTCYPSRHPCTAPRPHYLLAYPCPAPPVPGTSDVFQWAIDGTLWYTLKKVFLAGFMACFAVLRRIKLSTKFHACSAGIFRPYDLVAGYSASKENLFVLTCSA